MMVQDLIVFDTSMLPEYYNDVHLVLALPAGHVVTYDYNARHVSSMAQAVLRAFSSEAELRVVLAYVQPVAYLKGNGSDDTAVLQAPTVQMLTRLAHLVAVREVKNEERVRYYIDLKLEGYPFDRDRSIANSLVHELRSAGEMPMATYVAVYPSTSTDALFTQRADEQAFSQVVEALSSPNSQFAQDTFWRLTEITYRTKSLIPLWSTKEKPLVPRVETVSERSSTILQVVDQSIIYFDLQFQRGQEHGRNYRMRRISIEGSPKSSSELVRSTFLSRSFGREVVSVSIPATSSLAAQNARFQLFTQLHEKDEQKDYPYGPQLAINVRFQKARVRSALAVINIVIASMLFALAALSTSIVSTAPIKGYTVPLECRTVAIALGVIFSLYAYYLWSDDVALDKVRRN